MRLRGVVVGGRSEPWARLGFEIDGDRFAVGAVTFAFTGREPGGIRAWDVGLDGDVEGLAHESVDPVAEVAHANGVVAVDHLVATTPDLDRTTAALGRLGIQPHRTVEAIPGREGRRFRFFLLGTAVLELIGPTAPRGERPARFAGVAFATERLGALADSLGDLLGEVHDAVQPGRRIASVREEAAGLGVPVAFMTPRG